jgi:hypothetical protein
MAHSPSDRQIIRQDETHPSQVADGQDRRQSRSVPLHAQFLVQVIQLTRAIGSALLPYFHSNKKNGKEATSATFYLLIID